MTDHYQMVVFGTNQNGENHANNLGDEQPEEASFFNNLFYSMDANTILRNAHGLGTYLCVGSVILILGAIIFGTAFSTCTNVKIENNTGDLLFFNSVNPRGARVHKPFTYPYSRNNATFGFSNDHVSLGTANKGKLIAYDNGECELSGGPSNRDFKKYSLSPFFYTCYCEYKAVSSDTNSSSKTRYLRGIDQETFVAEKNITKDHEGLSI